MFQYATEEILIIVTEYQFVYLITLNTMWTLFDTLSKINEIMTFTCHSQTINDIAVNANLQYFRLMLFNIYSIIKVSVYHKCIKIFNLECLVYTK